MSEQTRLAIGQVAEALDEAQYHAVQIDGTIADNNTEAVGLIVNKPKINENGSYAVAGVARFRAGDTITAGLNLSVTDSGWLITGATSGDIPVGFALDAVSSGGIGEGFFNFAGAKSTIVA